MRKPRFVVSTLLLFALLFHFAAPAFACGPSSVVPVFEFESRPDLEWANYANGQLGIVRSEYYNPFLFAAYRHLTDAPFTPDEQKELVKVWNAELYRENSQESDTNAAVKTWLTARKKVLPDEAEPKIYTERQWDNGYGFFPNCTANAFETAAKTLDSRAAAHGATSEAVKDWARAQDVVFGNCYEGKNTPAETAAGSPEWLKNDREYQLAAAKFYAADFADAKTRFEKIAANRSSAWQTTANYLVARTLLRQASEIDDYDVEQLKIKRRPFYEQAEAHLQKILGDATQREYHEAANRLMNLVKYRLRPNERIHELASILTQKSENKNLRQDLIDYIWLIEKTDAKGKDDDITDWISTFQTNTEESYQHSLKRWRESNSAAWFVAALSKAKKENPQVTALLAHAETIEKNSPAFATVAYHQNRLLMETGKIAEARAKLNFLLTNRMTVFPISARNAFLSQRMMLAENLDEFLQYAPRRAAAFAVDGSPAMIENFSAETLKDWEEGRKIAAWRERVMFDQDVVRIFNEQMPLALMKQAALSQKLPDYLRRNLLIASWTRAFLLNDDKTAQELAPSLAKHAPELNVLLTDYQAAKTPAERQNAGLYLLLKFPMMRPNVDGGYGRTTEAATIDSYRDNWWCAPQDFYYNNDGEKVALESSPAPIFLTAANKSEAARERDKLKVLGNSSTYLARRAAEFAAKSPSDPRLAEALHLAVRSTRYGCQDCETGKFSKAAHDILKKQFPRSEWTKKTPYWFKDESCSQN
jgi:hypothetical protein